MQDFRICPESTYGPTYGPNLTLPQAGPEEQKSCLYQGFSETTYSGGQAWARYKD